MTSEVSAIGARLARRLRELRLARQWSLDDLAARSGISRATLSRMEKGDVSPTATVLGQVCAAFALTMSRVLSQVEDSTAALVPRDRQPVWIDPETGFHRRSVSPPSPDFDCELLECELPGGARIAYPAAPRFGLEHHLYLLAGALDLTVDDRTHALAAGDCLRYRLYGASVFSVPPGEPARYVLVVR